MNALFVTQGLGLRLMHALATRLRTALPLERAGFYVSDSMFFRQFVRDTPEFREHEPNTIKEWEIMAAARRGGDVDRARLREIERRMTPGVLWDAVICDRRLMLGPRCKERQDYRPRFTQEQILAILDFSLTEISALYDRVQPDVQFSFVPVTFGEYLFYLYARSRAVPTLFLGTTKIENYVTWMDDFFGCPPHIAAIYEEYRRGGGDRRSRDAALAYVRGSDRHLAKHEGMIPVPGALKRSRSMESPFKRAGRILRAELQYRLTESRHDNHIPGILAPLLYRRWVTPTRARYIDMRLRRRYVRAPDLALADYVFYPLNAEPEVALSIHARAFQNQIEVVRNAARSLPVGVVLLTKEHPRCHGYRPLSYYEKLLDIPNVRIADPRLEAHELLGGARLVLNLSSWVGFEAALHRRPVVTLARRSFNVLPSTMVRHAEDPSRLPQAIAEAMANYEYDEAALVAFVAANRAGSVQLDFYSRFLGKRGRYEVGEASESTERQLDQLTAYTVGRVGQATGVSAAAGA